MALATSTYVAIAAVAASAAAGYEQRRQSKAAAKDQEEAAKTSQAEEMARQNETRRQQIREERIRRATIMQQSANTGVSASSGEIGAVSALGTQTAVNQASLSRQAMTAQDITNESQQAAQHELKGQEAAAIGSIAGSIFSYAAPYAADDISRVKTNIFG